MQMDAVCALCLSVNVCVALIEGLWQASSWDTVSISCGTMLDNNVSHFGMSECMWGMREDCALCICGVTLGKGQSRAYSVWCLSEQHFSTGHFNLLQPAHTSASCSAWQRRPLRESVRHLWHTVVPQ